MMQAAVLTGEFYFNLIHFCDKVNIFNQVRINGEINSLSNKAITISRNLNRQQKTYTRV
jgi:hypothetical protein